MSLTKLLSIVQFQGVAAGGSVSLPHGLNNGQGDALVPDKLERRSDGTFTVSADDTDVTVTNNGSEEQDIDVLCWHWHSILRQLGADADLPIMPWESMGDALDSSLASAANTPTVYWRQDAPADKLAGLAFDNFAEAHAAGRALVDAGYRRVYLHIDTQYTQSTIVYDQGGPDQETLNVGIVPTGVWDMDGLWVQSTFNPNLDFTRITFADGAIWDNVQNLDGYRLDIISSSLVAGTGIRLGPSFGFNILGGRMEMYASDAAAVPLIYVDAANPFGGFFPVPNLIFATMLGRGGFPTLAPVFDINGALFALVEYCGRGVNENTITDSVGGGFLQVVDLQGNGTYNWNQPGLAASTVVLGTFMPDYTSRGSSPAFNTLFAVSQAGPPTVPAVLDATNTWGPVVLADSTHDTVDVNLPTAVDNAGEQFIVKDWKRQALVNTITLNAVAGETIQIGAGVAVASYALAAIGESVRLVSDGQGGWSAV